MYVVAPVMGIWMVAAIFNWAPYPKPFGMFIGVTIGWLFTIASIYSTVIMLRRQPRQRTADQRSCAT